MPRPLPPLNAARAFEAAARHLSFIKAAEELHVTPGAISQQVRALEEWVGRSLFRRLPKGVRLTDAGQELWPKITDAFDMIADAATKTRNGSNTNRRSARRGCGRTGLSRSGSPASIRPR